MRVQRLIPIVILALAACAESSGPRGRGLISLAVSSRQPAAVVAANVLLAGDSTFLVAEPDTVVVGTVELVLRRIKLQPVAVAACEDDNGEDVPEAEDTESTEDSEGCEEIKVGPVLVSLPLGTTAVEALVDIGAPAGQYDQLQFKVHAPELPRDAEFLATNPDFEGVSIRVTGTFSHAGARTDFVYESALDVEQEVSIDPPLTVDASGVASLTLRFDIATWFAGPGGIGLVDPATANAGGANESLVAGNIQRSINAFEDDDEDGHDDNDADDDPDGGSGGGD